MLVKFVLAQGLLPGSFWCLPRLVMLAREFSDQRRKHSSLTIAYGNVVGRAYDTVQTGQPVSYLHQVVYRVISGPHWPPALCQVGGRLCTPTNPHRYIYRPSVVTNPPELKLV